MNCEHDIYWSQSWVSFLLGLHLKGLIRPGTALLVQKTGKADKTQAWKHR